MLLKEKSTLSSCIYQDTLHAYLRPSYYSAVFESVSGKTQQY